MPSSSAKRRAFAASLEASASISHHSLPCIAGITFFTAILAVPNTPHLILFLIFLASETFWWPEIAGPHGAGIYYQPFQHHSGVDGPEFQQMNTRSGELVF